MGCYRKRCIPQKTAEPRLSLLLENKTLFFCSFLKYVFFQEGLGVLHVCHTFQKKQLTYDSGFSSFRMHRVDLVVIFVERTFFFAFSSSLGFWLGRTIPSLGFPKKKHKRENNQFPTGVLQVRRRLLPFLGFFWRVGIQQESLYLLLLVFHIS